MHAGVCFEAKQIHFAQEFQHCLSPLLHFSGGREGDGVYLRLGAYQFIVPLGWPLVRGFWAVNRINTVIVQ
mgnify:CR=1 FL=1